VPNPTSSPATIKVVLPASINQAQHERETPRDVAFGWPQQAADDAADAGDPAVPATGQRRSGNWPRPANLVLRAVIAGAESAAPQSASDRNSSTGKPSSIQPVIPPAMVLTGRPSCAMRSAARTAALQWGTSEYVTKTVPSG
jgi:hypothetical protein